MPGPAFARSHAVRAIRAAISLGGDADTQAAIAGAAAAAAAYDGGLPRKVEAEVRRRLMPDMLEVLTAFEARFPTAKNRAR